LQLRRRQGVDRQAFLEQTGVSVDELAGSAISQMVEEGLLEEEGPVVRLSRRGLLVADALITRLWAVAGRRRFQGRRRYNLPVMKNVPE
jgi:coproporphyrinogen III oxidase-like Fe-S oxidoreductase